MNFCIFLTVQVNAVQVRYGLKALHQKNEMGGKETLAGGVMRKWFIVVMNWSPSKRCIYQKSALKCHLHCWIINTFKIKWERETVVNHWFHPLWDNDIAREQQMTYWSLNATFSQCCSSWTSDYLPVILFHPRAINKKGPYLFNVYAN